jgi:hypothetical protein
MPKTRYVSTVALYDGCDWFEIAVGDTEWAKVDLVDIMLVLGCSWWVDDMGFARTASDERMHRVILGLPPKNPHVDHKNHDRLDNRRSNLRIVTQAQNNTNRRKRAGTSSRFKGVTWSKPRQKWEAQIQVDGWHRMLGRFATEEEAARAYNQAALAAWGEFAFLNEV